MAIKHNTNLDREAKKYLPESHKLDVDRLFTAERVVTDINEWKDRTDKVDLKGFDTRDAKEKSIDKVLMSNYGVKTTADLVLMTEPDRFLRNDQESRRLLEKNKDKIYDFNSFKEQLKGAWGQDSSLLNLLDNVTDFDKCLKPMFSQSVVQSWLQENIRPQLIQYIKKKFNVEPIRAMRIISKLDDSTRRKLYIKAKFKSLPKIRIPKARKPSIGIRKTPRWSEQEKNIIKQNLDIHPDRITEIFKQAGYNRSDTSIRNTYYRFRREK